MNVQKGSSLWVTTLSFVHKLFLLQIMPYSQLLFDPVLYIVYIHSLLCVCSFLQFISSLCCQMAFSFLICCDLKEIFSPFHA